MLTGMVVQWGSLLFLLGWYGAERVFFQRHLEDKPVTLRHLLGLVKPFIGRFFVLGLPFGIVICALCGFVFAASFAAALKGAKPQDVHWPLWFWVSFYLLLIAMDFALTFVTSALAYTTRSARRAVHIGFGMIRQTWPSCALYVLCPPLALNVMAFMFPVSMSGVRLVLDVVLALAWLLAKGAIAAFYLRERGSYSDDGAAYISSEVEPAAA
jgi:hypothetical protein